MYFEVGLYSSPNGDFPTFVWPSDWPAMQLSEFCSVFPIGSYITFEEGGVQQEYFCNSSPDILLYPGFDFDMTVLEAFDATFECTPGDAIIEDCWDGSTITIQTCDSTYNWVLTAEICPVEEIESLPEPEPEEPLPELEEPAEPLVELDDEAGDELLVMLGLGGVLAVTMAYLVSR